MRADPEENEEGEPAPPPPGTNKVEITVAGHTVLVESADPLVDVVGYAMGIFEQTAAAARRIPIGFDIAGGQFERAEPYLEPTGVERWEEEGERSCRGGATRRLDIGVSLVRLHPFDRANR